MQQPVELKFSRASAVTGMLTCTICIASLGATLWVGFARNLFGRPGHFAVAVAMLVGVLAFGTLLALMASRANDRSVKLLITSDGIQDFRSTGGFIPWREVNDIKLRGKLTNIFIDMATLILNRRSGEIIEIDLGGLDLRTDMIYTKVKQMLEGRVEATKSTGVP
jgi:hypothetical protein